MKGLTYCNGYFPFCIQNATVWDGTTFSPGAFGRPVRTNDLPLNHPNNLVVGPGTDYPFSCTLEEAGQLYWRVSQFLHKLDITRTDGLSNESNYFLPEISLPVLNGYEIPSGFSQDNSDYLAPLVYWERYFDGVLVDSVFDGNAFTLKVFDSYGFSSELLFTDWELLESKQFCANTNAGFSAIVFNEDGSETADFWQQETSEFDLFTEGIRFAEGAYWPFLRINPIGAVAYELGGTEPRGGIAKVGFTSYQPVGGTEVTATTELNIGSQKFEIPMFSTLTDSFDGKYEVFADKYFSYGGIYDEDTGAKI